MSVKGGLIKIYSKTGAIEMSQAMNANLKNLRNTKNENMLNISDYLNQNLGFHSQ